MRPIALVLAAATMVSGMLVSGPAQSAWKEYAYKDLGFLVEFPADPSLSSGTFKSLLAQGAPVHIFSQKQDNTVFIASVVDLQNHADEGASLLLEAELNVRLMGDLTSSSVDRVEPGADAVFGHFVTINCNSKLAPELPGQADAARAWFKNVTGVNCPDGTHLQANLFFNRGRLYLVYGMNIPDQDGDASTSPASLRFVNSVSFFLADGSRNWVDLDVSGVRPK